MELQSGNKIISGIEPVDALLGRLDRGQLYLVHGEASEKSLFGIKFLIEGLKQGENGALVIRYSPEDAVQRFARAGYDCLQDVYSGRLVILEYSDDIIQKIGKLRDITPVLRELEWLLGETRPERLIFDPVASVLADAEGDLVCRANAFAEWARSFGATVVLIANEANPEIVRAFQSLVAESFRFDIGDVTEDAAPFIAFETSSAIPDQAIEVDSSRGIFLPYGADVPERADSNDAVPHPPSMAELESIREELREFRDVTPKEKPEPAYEANLTGDCLNILDATQPKTDTASVVSHQRPDDNLKTQRLTPIEEEEFQAPRANLILQPTSESIEELELQFGEPIKPAEAAPLIEGQLDELSDLLDDLAGATSPLDLDLPAFVSPASEVIESMTDQADSVTQNSDLFGGGPGVTDPCVSFIASDKSLSRRKADQAQMRHGRASDLSIDSAMAARAAELLLHPPEGTLDPSFPVTSFAPLPTVHKPTHQASAGENEVWARDFNVLIIEDDAETCDLLTQTLNDYSLEVVHDGVSGLARLISLKPDLVVLDFDLPIIDGFKVLTLIRSALNVPIIIVSGSRMRAIDRVMASELGADYYLTKPFSAKELKHKARQLIARYRGVSSWIMTPAGDYRPEPSRGGSESSAPASLQDRFIPYSEFAAEVEKSVKVAMDKGASFSIVGCRLKEMTEDGGRFALRLLGIVRDLARDADLSSTNPRNDLVTLLADTGAAGARAFAARLRARVLQDLNREPVVWLRSFPDLEDSIEATAAPAISSDGAKLNRRSSDRTRQANNHARRAPRADEKAGGTTDPRDSYIDLLEHL